MHGCLAVNNDWAALGKKSASPWILALGELAISMTVTRGLYTSLGVELRL